jgi:hypothetical protein
VGLDGRVGQGRPPRGRNGPGATARSCTHVLSFRNRSPPVRPPRPPTRAASGSG